MAIKSTVFKANLSIADIEHGYYADHNLTLARHPSETDERMMVRLAALALNAHALQTVCEGNGNWAFGAGLSDPDDPDVCLRDYTGRPRLWIEVGIPEDRPLSKACGKADAVAVYAYQSSADLWWNAIQGKLTRLRNLEVWRMSTASSQALAAMAERSMQLQATVQDGQLMLSNASTSVEVACERLMP
jgi:uncharacterized protein YaeQ